LDVLLPSAGSTATTGGTASPRATVVIAEYVEEAPSTGRIVIIRVVRIVVIINVGLTILASSPLPAFLDAIVECRDDAANDKGFRKNGKNKRENIAPRR